MASKAEKVREQVINDLLPSVAKALNLDLSKDKNEETLRSAIRNNFVQYRQLLSNIQKDVAIVKTELTIETMETVEKENPSY